MRKLSYLIATIALMVSSRGEACTNIIVTPGASADGSAMVSYAADSHWLYGELYFQKAARLCILTILTPILMMLTPSKRAGLSKSSLCLLANRQRRSRKDITFSFS